MKSFTRYAFAATIALGLMIGVGDTAVAGTFIQCPGDTDVPSDGIPDGPVFDDEGERRDIFCQHLTASDGFSTMADSRRLYMFGFANVTGVSEPLVQDAGTLAAASSAPSLVLDQGQEVYLTLTNVGMQIRPDLFDPHTVHFHGFPNASVIFDGVPDNSVSVNQGASITYYYNLVEPGTFMYHCHVEATEHMQMGMMGNLYVRPAQNKLMDGTVLGTHVHSNPDNNNPLDPTHPADDDPLDGDKYVYNDGDGETLYDVEYPIQISSWDGEFHQASEDVQPLPFAEMLDNYGLINGRGYPETADARGLTFPSTPGSGANPGNTASPSGHLETSQPVSSLITVYKATEPKVLLRMSNLSITNFFTVATTLGVPMKVVGNDQRLLRGGGKADGENFMYETNSVMMGGGETVDVLIDVSNVPTGTYFLYSTELNFLSNDQEDFGGIMTEIEVL
jgi:FtsP/CotA-like multicopper oxidase with cupredoxin domain